MPNTRVPPPMGLLFYLDFVYQNEDKIRKAYTVTESNIDEVKLNFRKNDIQIGDIVEDWDEGGWHALAGRAGEQIVRDGEIIHKRLTRML